MREWFTKLRARFVSTDQIAQQSIGSRVVVEDWTNVLMGCCDCGLMHRYHFSQDGQGRLIISARRDATATFAIRRDKPFPCTLRVLQRKKDPHAA